MKRPCTLFGVADRVSFVEIVAEEYTWLSNQFFKFSHDGIRCNVMFLILMSGFQTA